jgi:PAS domain S-box-containing protein
MSARFTSLRVLWLGWALVVVPSFALLGLGIYNGTMIVPALRQSQDLVAHSIAVITTTQALERALQDAERGQRGFLITGEPAYLEPYRTGAQDIPPLLSRLQQLTADNPEQQRRWSDLQRQINVKMTELGQTIQVRRTDGFDAARQIVLTNVGRDSMLAIDRVIDAGVAEENRLLAEREAQGDAAQAGATTGNLLRSALAFVATLFGVILVTLTARRLSHSETALHESEQRFRLMVSGITDSAIVMLDTEGSISSWNRGAERILLYRPGEIIGQHYKCFFTPEDAAAGLPDRQLDTTLTAGSTTSEGWRLRKDGSKFWASASLTAIRDEQGNLRGFAKLIRDMTERREAELALRQTNDELSQQIAARDQAVESLNHEMRERERAEGILRQVQKMDVLGQLTGGIAHDFNNMLAVIVTNLETLQRRLPPGDARLHDPVAMALQGAERSALLTHRLLAFARRQPLEPRPADVNKLVAGMSNFIRRTLGETIAIEFVLGEEIWSVPCDINQLENALLNLAVNARDAMPNGGKLTIETANVHLDEAYAAANVEVTAGQYVMLAVSDTGAGMSQAIIEKAFEPFFTTKEAGQGTGLGLSQVYGFVKQSNGHIKIYSELGQGTTVKLYMPRLAAGEMAAAEERVPPPSVATEPCSQSILLVEDNEFLATTVLEILTEQGYRALLAPDGETAIRILEANPDINLLFTDVGLPGALNGRQLADEAKRRWPELKVLFTTGYTQNAIIHHGRLDPGVELIGKPFTYAALAARIQRILR